MNDLLDQVIAATQGSARIVSEQHDLGKINWVQGLSDPGEMIRCGYRPELRRLANEGDEAYAERLQPLVLLLPKNEQDIIMGAAIGRADLDRSTGRIAVMVAGKAPWHALGVRVESAVNSGEAIKLASLDWLVKKYPLTYVFNGESRTSKDVFAVVREDTGAMLGSVGRVYKPIQNADGFTFLDNVLAGHGARYETAGAIHGGEKVWMLANLPGKSFEVVPGDRVNCYALFTNSHNGTEAGYCFPTSERVVCGNTYRTAGKDKKKGIYLRHTGNIQAKITDAQKALGIAVQSFDTFRENASVLAHKPLEPTHFVNDVLDYVLEVTAADQAKGADLLASVLQVTEAEREFARNSIAKKLERRGEILDDIMERYESERCGISGIRGTAWAAYNAVSEHADHNKIGRQVGNEYDRNSRRFDNVLTGPADDMKQAAMSLALSAN